MQVEVKSGRYLGLEWQAPESQVADILDSSGRHLWPQVAASGEKSVLMSGGRGLWNPQEEVL
jgi:hypothetical protein